MSAKLYIHGCQRNCIICPKNYLLLQRFRQYTTDFAQFRGFCHQNTPNLVCDVTCMARRMTFQNNHHNFEVRVPGRSLMMSCSLIRQVMSWILAMVSFMVLGGDRFFLYLDDLFPFRVGTQQPLGLETSCDQRRSLNDQESSQKNYAFVDRVLRDHWQTGETVERLRDRWAFTESPLSSETKSYTPFPCT